VFVTKTEPVSRHYVTLAVDRGVDPTEVSYAFIQQPGARLRIRLTFTTLRRDPADHRRRADPLNPQWIRAGRARRRRTDQQASGVT